MVGFDVDGVDSSDIVTSAMGVMEIQILHDLHTLFVVITTQGKINLS